MTAERPLQDIVIYIHLEPAETKSLPSHPENYWAEAKLDGIRAFLTVMQDQSSITITASTKDRPNNQGLDITNKFPEIVAGAKLLSHSVVLDGEIVYKTGKTVDERNIVLKRHSMSDFNNQKSCQEEPCTFTAFDILYLDGEDLSQLPYEERKRRLFELFDEETTNKTGIATVPTIPYVKEYTQVLEEQGFEGVIYKKEGSIYPNRKLSPSKRPWIKRRFRP